MPEVLIRDCEVADFQRIIAINTQQERHTSPMGLENAEWLCTHADYCKVVVVDNSIAGFVLVIRESAAYKNENFAWFSLRYDQFLYVDRIVIDNKYLGMGLGRQLYQNLYEYAREQQVAFITCEYNLVPSNVPSKAFHENFGFIEVGKQWLTGGAKQVSLQAMAVE